MTEGVWQFTIEDNTNPTVTNLDPGNGSEDVAVNATFEITFSENVAKNVGSIIIMNADENVEHETVDIATGPITVVGNVATFDPVNTFIGETNYYILVGESTFQDESPNHNNFAGITSSSAWTFTTIDTEPPLLATTSPADNATDVTLNTNLVVTFDEEIAIGSGNITLMDDQGVVEAMAVGSENISIAGNQLTINPTYDLEGLTNYYILIDNTAIEDLFNNSFAGISSADTWNFTTVDASAPAVTNLSPVDDDTGVNADANLVMTFDKTVVKTTGTITIMNSTESSIHEEIDVTTTQVSVSGNQVTIDPSVNFTDFDHYYVLVDNGAIQDLDGNSYPGISDPTVWNFTAGDYTEPTIVSVTPANNAENVSLTANLEIEFSENIAAGSGNIVIRNTSTGAALTTFDISAVDITANIAIMDPGPEFEENTAYHVLIDGGAFIDGSGNEFSGIADNSTWSFTTGDFTNPTISKLSPENNAVDVNVNTELYAIFNEEMIANTGLINIMSGTTTQESIDVLSGQVEINSDTVFIEPGFSMAGETEYHVLIDNGAFHDMAGNSFGGITDASTWKFTTEDITQPTVAITSTASGTVNEDFVVTIAFSEEVTGFEISDIEVTNADISDFTNVTNAKEWTVVVAPIENGEVTINVAAGVAQDAAGNTNTAANQFSITYDSGVGFEDIIPFEISMYSSGNRVIIEFINTENYQLDQGKVEIYNLVGQKIIEENIYNLERFETEVEHVSHIYVVKVTLNNSEYQKRLFVE
jgi:methionine-rich copper-binding protein CopC